MFKFLIFFFIAFMVYGEFLSDSIARSIDTFVVLNKFQIPDAELSGKQVGLNYYIDIPNSMNCERKSMVVHYSFSRVVRGMNITEGMDKPFLVSDIQYIEGYWKRQSDKSIVRTCYIFEESNEKVGQDALSCSEQPRKIIVKDCGVPDFI